MIKYKYVGTLDDFTALYDIILDKEYTVKEFVNEHILSLGLTGCIDCIFTDDKKGLKFILGRYDDDNMCYFKHDYDNCIIVKGYTIIDCNYKQHFSLTIKEKTKGYLEKMLVEEKEKNQFLERCLEEHKDVITNLSVQNSELMYKIKNLEDTIYRLKQKY